MSTPVSNNFFEFILFLLLFPIFMGFVLLYVKCIVVPILEWIDKHV